MGLTQFAAKIKRYAAQNTFVLTTLQTVWAFLRSCLYRVYSLCFRIDPHLVVLESYYGMAYACNPKALYEEMQRDARFSNYRFVWAFQKEGTPEERPNGVRTTIVTHNSHAYKKAMASAHYYIANSMAPNYIRFKKKQVYVQTWHGTPLKRLGCDITVDGNAVNTVSEIHNRYRERAARFDYMLSPSRFCTEKLDSAFALGEQNKSHIVLETGYPRNDFLFRFTEADVAAIKQRLQLPNDKKLLLYAPTFRDNQTKGDVFTYQCPLDFRSLCETLGEDWIILFRAHYLIANQFDFSAHRGRVVDVSGIDDINELYVISDGLLTDYSSVFFDFANLKRPIMFYMYDLAEYRDSIRNFYISLDELPGLITETQEELEKNIGSVMNHFEYTENYRRFNERFNYLDDAYSAHRALSIIFSEKERSCD